MVAVMLITHFCTQSFGICRRLLLLHFVQILIGSKVACPSHIKHEEKKSARRTDIIPTGPMNYSWTHGHWHKRRKKKKSKNASRNENETYNGTSIWGPYLSDPKKNANRAKNRVLKPLSLSISNLSGCLLIA